MSYDYARFNFLQIKREHGPVRLAYRFKDPTFLKNLIAFARIFLNFMSKLT